MGSKDRRRLAGIERTLVMFSRVSPINLVLVAGIGGPALDDLLPAALAALQRRHPLLRASIGGPRARPHFDIAAGEDLPPIPLQVTDDTESVLAVVTSE